MEEEGQRDRGSESHSPRALPATISNLSVNNGPPGLSPSMRTTSTSAFSDMSAESPGGGGDSGGIAQDGAGKGAGGGAGGALFQKLAAQFGDLNELQGKLEDIEKNNVVQALHWELGELRVQLKEAEILRQQYQKMQDYISKNTKNLKKDELRQQIVGLHWELGELRTEKRTLEQAMEFQKQRLVDAQIEGNEVEKAKETLTEREEELLQTTRKLELAEAKILRMEEENEIEREAVKQREIEHEEDQRKAFQVLKERFNLQTQLEEHKAEINELKLTLEHKRQLIKEMEELEAQRVAEERDSKTEKRMNRELTLDNKTLKGEVERLSTELKGLQEELELYIKCCSDKDMLTAYKIYLAMGALQRLETRRFGDATNPNPGETNTPAALQKTPSVFGSAALLRKGTAASLRQTSKVGPQTGMKDNNPGLEIVDAQGSMSSDAKSGADEEGGRPDSPLSSQGSNLSMAHASTGVGLDLEKRLSHIGGLRLILRPLLLGILDQDDLDRDRVTEFVFDLQNMKGEMRLEASRLQPSKSLAVIKGLGRPAPIDTTVGGEETPVRVASHILRTTDGNPGGLDSAMSMGQLRDAINQLQGGRAMESPQDQASDNSDLVATNSSNLDMGTQSNWKGKGARPTRSALRRQESFQNPEAEEEEEGEAITMEVDSLLFPIPSPAVAVPSGSGLSRKKSLVRFVGEEDGEVPGTQSDQIIVSIPYAESITSVSDGGSRPHSPFIQLETEEGEIKTNEGDGKTKEEEIQSRLREELFAEPKREPYSISPSVRELEEEAEKSAAAAASPPKAALSPLSRPAEDAAAKKGKAPRKNLLEMKGQNLRRMANRALKQAQAGQQTIQMEEGEQEAVSVNFNSWFYPVLSTLNLPVENSSIKRSVFRRSRSAEPTFQEPEPDPVTLEKPGSSGRSRNLISKVGQIREERTGQRALPWQGTQPDPDPHTKNIKERDGFSQSAFRRGKAAAQGISAPPGKGVIKLPKIGLAAARPLPQPKVRAQTPPFPQDYLTGDLPPPAMPL